MVTTFDRVRSHAGTVSVSDPIAVKSLCFEVSYGLVTERQTLRFDPKGMSNWMTLTKGERENLTGHIITKTNSMRSRRLHK